MCVHADDVRGRGREKRREGGGGGEMAFLQISSQIFQTPSNVHTGHLTPTQIV